MSSELTVPWRSAAGKHPAQVLASAMKAVGAGETLGEVSGVIPGLFT